MATFRSIPLLLASVWGLASCTTTSSPLPESTLRQKQYAQRIIAGSESTLAPVYGPLAEYICERFDLADKAGIGIDIGGGPGNLIIELCRRTRMHWINADINPHFFSHCFEQAEREGVAHRISAILADAHQLPFHDDYADVIVSRGTFHYWNDKAKAFSEIHRVLKPGGVAFIGRGFSPNLPIEDARLVRAKQKAAGFRMYDVAETAAELEQALEAAEVTRRDILIMKSPEDESINYGIWVAIHKTRPHSAVERDAPDHDLPHPDTQPSGGFHPVTCEGMYRHHLQGVCADRKAIYWSFTTQLVKTDLDGRILRKISVANHHGDLCFYDGKVYVAVNLGKFNHPEGHADSWVYVYRADNLLLASKHPTPEVFHGAGGIGIRNDHFVVVGGLPDGVQENYAYEYDTDLRFIKRHVIKSGHTLMGIQTAAFANGRWFFGCYGTPDVLLVTDVHFRMLGRYEYDCSLGIEGLPDGRMLSAIGRCEEEVGCTASIKIAAGDPKSGLRIIQNEQ